MNERLTERDFNQAKILFQKLLTEIELRNTEVAILSKKLKKSEQDNDELQRSNINLSEQMKELTKELELIKESLEWEIDIQKYLLRSL